MSILVIAPHADDEIIGVGGTMLRAVENQEEVYVCVVTKGCPPLFDDNYIRRLREETLACHEQVGVKKSFFLEFPSVMLEQEKRYIINEKISEVIQGIRPDEVYLPHIGDMQKDHQIVAEAAMVALRPKYQHVVKRIYAYETLSETGWHIPNVQNQFIPTMYCDISGQMKKKLEAMSLYQSQLGRFPNPRSLQAIEALARFRGSTVNCLAAEAFSLIREIRVVL